MLARPQAGWTYAPKDENVCVMMVGNYQPEAAGLNGSSSPSKAAAVAGGGTDLEALYPNPMRSDK